MSDTDKYIPTKQVQLFRQRVDFCYNLQGLLEDLKPFSDNADAYLVVEVEQDYDNCPEEYLAVYVDVPQTPEEIEADYKSFEEDIINQIAGLQHQLKQLKEQKEMVIGQT